MYKIEKPTYNRFCASYKRYIFTLKRKGMNWDHTKTSYKCKRRINDRRINDALLYFYLVHVDKYFNTGLK